jgi:hypothetical protein
LTYVCDSLPIRSAANAAGHLVSHPVASLRSTTAIWVFAATRPGFPRIAGKYSNHDESHHEN